jgi:hypothetical protein
MLTKVHEFIDSNFEDVGNKFADEALRMHRGEKELNNIRGTASVTARANPPLFAAASSK